MAKKLNKPGHSLLVMLLFLSGCFTAKGQLLLSGQLRTRTEYRNGAGTLASGTFDPAFFTSQRTRLTFHYNSSRLVFHTSIQDIRVWGQDASTINNNDGSKLSVHEAWAELVLANKTDSSFQKKGIDYFGIKIGRQELMYDDSRLLGNLDWLQQARRHDAIVFKLLNKGWQVDLGAAFNQNTDAFNYNGTYYTPANVSPYVKDSKGNLAPTPAGLIPLTNSSGWSMKSGAPALQAAPSTNGLYQDYKALQYLYVARTLHSTHVSALIVADHFGKYSTDSVKNISGTDTGYIYGRHFNQHGVNSRITDGFLINSFLTKQKDVSLAAGFYYQTGKDRDGLSLDAFTTTLSVSIIERLLTYTAGWDYVSGNNAYSSNKTNHRFDPLYGTPHKFWGYMDYFYAGTGSPAGGLNDPYLKIKYTGKRKRWGAGLDYHYFTLAQDQKDINGSAIKKYLGSEFDLVTNYSLSKVVALEWGFSIMAATSSMEYAKSLSPGSSRLTGSWSYLMLTLKPEFFSKEK